MNYRFFSTLFLMISTITSSVFCFLTPHQEQVFLDVVKEISSQKNSTSSWQRIENELHNYTYNFHTLLLIISRAEEQLDSAFSLPIYYALQELYQVVYNELWDKLSEVLQPINREAITKDLDFLFDYSDPVKNYNILENKSSREFPQYVFRRNIVSYFLTLQGLSEIAEQSPGMLVYSSDEKKQQLLHARTKLYKMLSYHSDEASMSTFIEGEKEQKKSLSKIFKDLPEIMQIFEKEIESRFIAFEHEDFIVSTLPALTSSALKISAAISSLAGIAWLWVIAQRLNQIPFREKVVPAITEGRIFLHNFNRLTAGWTKEDLKQWYTEKEAQMIREGKKIVEPGRQLIETTNHLITKINGKDIQQENGENIHQPGFIELLTGYDITERGVHKHIPGTVEHVNGITQNVRVMVGEPTVNQKGEINTMGKLLGRANARAQNPLSEPSEEALRPITAELFQQTLQAQEILLKEPPHHGEGADDEEVIIEPQTPEGARRGWGCSIQ